MNHEKHMIKVVLCAVAVGLILAFSAIALAQSFGATCPYDGEPATLSHTVGFGAQRVCWYSHIHTEIVFGHPPKNVKHEFYQPCPVQ